MTLKHPSGALGGFTERVIALGRHPGIRKLARNGPLAIAASSFPGAVNYVAILYLTFAFSAEQTGVYRLLFSWFSLYGLASLFESNKVFIRSIAEGDRRAPAIVLVNRLLLSMLAAVVTCAVWASARAMGHAFPTEIIWISLLAALFYPLNAYQSYYQVKGWFNLLFLTEFVKYGSALMILIGLIHSGRSVISAVMWQFAAMTAFNVIFFVAACQKFLSFKVFPRSVKGLLLEPSAREARSLSLANALPSALEHIDKMVIGAVFGLHALGIYTLGFTSGRFIYNALKPALYIYYKQFVTQMPTRRVLTWLGIGFTVIGALLSIAFVVATQFLPKLAPLRGSEGVTVIIFLAYGVAMVDAVYLQAYSINKHTKSDHVLVANTAASMVCLIMFAICTLLPAAFALPLFAFHYGLRHALSIYIVSLLRRRAGAASNLEL